MGADAQAAPPVGKDGKIHACYRVKGKPKGALRVVSSAKKRCRRGERRVVWSVTGTAGQPGSTGQAGDGQQGQAGASEPTSTAGTAALESRIAALTLKVESLEDVLGDVTNADLTGMVSTLDGVSKGQLSNAIKTSEALTNTDLTEAVNSLPAIKALCSQTGTVTDGINDLGLGITGISVLGLPGLSLNTASLPGDLDPFSCVAP